MAECALAASAPHTASLFLERWASCRFEERRLAAARGRQTRTAAAAAASSLAGELGQTAGKRVRQVGHRADDVDCVWISCPPFLSLDFRSAPPSYLVIWTGHHAPGLAFDATTQTHVLWPIVSTAPPDAATPSPAGTVSPAVAARFAALAARVYARLADEDPDGLRGALTCGGHDAEAQVVFAEHEVEPPTCRSLLSFSFVTAPSSFLSQAVLRRAPSWPLSCSRHALFAPAPRVCLLAHGQS